MQNTDSLGWEIGLRYSSAMENQMKTVRDAPDVLDLNNSGIVGGGGMGDTYSEDAASENQPFTPWTRNVARYAFLST